MKRVYDFLVKLGDNNNREWFNKNKGEYLQVQEIFNRFVEKLIADIEGWDEQIRDSHLQVKDCTYRIYRDTRFSKDKSPYKTHMGAYICRSGKKSPYAGYYFHLEPSFGDGATASGYLGNSLLAAGLYCPDTKIVQSLRDEISVNGDSLLDAISEAQGFELETYNVLKKVPRGYEDIEERRKDLIKHKDFSIGMSLPLELLDRGDDELLEYVSARFKSCRHFNELLNMAVEYAIEEM